VPVLAQFERGELQAGGFFSVVLGAFTRPVEESAVNVSTFALLPLAVLLLSV
jgi:hypothetical protein